jgi:hypothetical protein
MVSKKTVNFGIIQRSRVQPRFQDMSSRTEHNEQNAETKHGNFYADITHGPDNRFSCAPECIKMLSNTHESACPSADTIDLNNLLAFVHSCAIRNNSCLRIGLERHERADPNETTPIKEQTWLARVK